jgi:biotin carboxyl carrier protein
MNATQQRSHSRSRLSGTGVRSAFAAVIVCVICPQAAMCRTPYQSGDEEMMMFQSAGAIRVMEKVRSACQGVMFSLYVKPGDPVSKGQLLGNAELDATKLQLDLAKHTMEAKANVDAAKGQSDAWTVTREETEEAVRRRKVEESRLDWAVAMERMYRATYEMQLDAENLQQIHYDYWKDQYDKRFFRAPVEGVVTDVLVDVGKPVTFGTHLFTISDDSSYILPVSVPAAIADAAVPNETVPVRAADGKSVSNAVVEGVSDDPRAVGHKIIRLLVKAADFPAAVRVGLKGMKFDVLLPQFARQSHH